MWRADIEVRHRTPEVIERPDICGRASSIPAVFAERVEVDLPDLDGHDRRLNRSVREDGANAARLTWLGLGSS